MPAKLDMAQLHVWLQLWSTELGSWTQRCSRSMPSWMRRNALPSGFFTKHEGVWRGQFISGCPSDEHMQVSGVEMLPSTLLALNIHVYMISRDISMSTIHSTKWFLVARGSLKVEHLKQLRHPYASNPMVEYEPDRVQCLNEYWQGVVIMSTRSKITAAKLGSVRH